MRNNLKYERNILIIVYIITVILFVSSIYYFAYFPTMKFNPKINYKNLNSSQIEMTNRLISELKPSYLNLCISISFVNDTNDLKYSSFVSEFKFDKNTEGYNWNKNIYMILEDDLDYNKLILCHEILHSILPKNDEEYAYDLMDYGVCYK